MESSTSEDLSVIQLSCGSSHTVALLDCSIVVSWGRGEDGQLGHGDAEDLVEPKVIYHLLDAGVSSICCGAEYTLAVCKARKEVYSWGWGDFGRLGHGSSSDVFLPQPISFFSGKGIVQVACGDSHTLAVTAEGDLYSFGRNQNGQLGIGHNIDSLVPVLVSGLKGKAISSVACGAEHTVVATSEGEVYSWGWGRYGNLGDGDVMDRWTPTRAKGLDNIRVTTVACGWRHSAAVSSGGEMYTFGWSKYGQLGHGNYEDCLVPTVVGGLQGKTISLIAGGWRHTAAADSDGRIYCWGWNKFGQLGVGDNTDRNAPTEVQGLSGHPVKLLSCGWRHTVCLTSDGSMFSWGRGVNGQLGHGVEEDIALPTKVIKLSAGGLKKSEILATATSTPGGYVSPADRYAVVPEGDDGRVDGVVPNGPQEAKKARMGFSEVPEVPQV